MENNKVSIITPCYNAERFIAQAIESVLAQTYTDWEMLIVDDCSKDNTIKIVQQYVDKDERIKLFCLQENSGAGIARNKSIEEAKGRFIAFLDSDDIWFPNKLETQINFMLDNNYESVCSWYEYVDLSLKYCGVQKMPPKISFNDLFKGYSLGTPGVVIDVNKLGKRYFSGLKTAEDWVYFVSISKEVSAIYSYPQVLWQYRNVGNVGSASSNKIRQIKNVVRGYKEICRCSDFKAWCLFVFLYSPNYFVRKLKTKLDS